MDSVFAKSDLKELELNALLEVTQAINDNLPEEALYRIYRFTLLANLKIKKLALYVNEEDWECKVFFGIKANLSSVALPEEYQEIRENRLIGFSEDEFGEFDMVFPVLHKDRLLAVVFIGEISDMEESVETNTTFLKAITNIIMVAIENKKLARRELQQEAYRKELEIAKQVQQLLFPKELPKNERVYIEAFYQPHHEVSGDYYDFIEISPQKFLICIADVSGKGVPAAMWMSNFQATLRTLVRQTDHLIDIVNELNFNIIRSGDREMFITFFAAIYDFDKKELSYVNAGHNPPMLVTDDGLDLLQKGTTVIGAFDPLPFIDQGVVEGIESFFLFSYTDGITETFNDVREEFGQERLEEIIKLNAQKDLNEVHDLLIESLDEFRKGTPHTDDITILSCKVNNCCL